MACKEDRYTVGDRTYLIRQMPPRLSVPVQVFLAKTLGRPLFEGFATGKLQLDGAVAMVVALFTDRLDDASLLKTMHTVFRYVGIDGKVIRICEESNADGIDEHFAGRNKELWQVFIKALQVNFADFFGDGRWLSSFKSLLMARLSSNLPTSTSTSGGPASQTQSSAETSTSSKTEPTP